MKLDYSYWQNRVRNAKDEDLNQIHEDFFKKLGRVIDQIKIYDDKTKQVIPPKLINKDLFVKKLIQEKENMKTSWGME